MSSIIGILSFLLSLTRAHLFLRALKNSTVGMRGLAFAMYFPFPSFICSRVVIVPSFLGGFFITTREAPGGRFVIPPGASFFSFESAIYDSLQFLEGIDGCVKN